MTLWLPQYKVLYLHIPRCGGNWIKHALRLNNIEIQVVPVPQCCDCQHVPNPWNGKRIQPEFVFTTVREPFSWYESWWRFNQPWVRGGKRDGWTPYGCIDSCLCQDFEKFVLRVMEQQPSFVTRMYEWFCGPPELSNPLVIGKQENLVHDTFRILTGFGVRLRRESFKAIGPINESTKRKPTYSKELKEMVLRLERPALERFYQRG